VCRMRHTLHAIPQDSCVNRMIKELR
jgi:hypothetical protein